jgi:hypothetical protein
MHDMGKLIREWMEKENHDIGTLRWIDADIIHNASIAGNMGELFKAIRQRAGATTGPEANVVVVGPPHIHAIKNSIGDAIWVYEVREQNCWQDNRKVKAELAALMDAPGMLFLFCAGMASKVWIDYLWGQRRDCTLVDIGSAFDPYCNVRSRRYHDAILQQMERGET